MKALVAARALWGLTLLVAPGAVLRDLPHERVDVAARLFARLLGARHLAEAAVLGRRHSAGWILGGAAVDTTHAATMAALAFVRPERRLLATANALAAAAMATAGVVEARRA